MIKEGAPIKTAFFLMKDWSRNLNLPNNWAAMYTLNFQLCLGSFDSEPPHCKILLFFKSFCNKRTIHHLSGKPGYNPYSCITGIFWNTCTDSLRKKKLLGKDMKLWGRHRPNHAESSTGKATGICVCVRTHVCLCAWGLQTNLLRDQYGLWIQPFGHTTPLLFLALGNRW